MRQRSGIFVPHLYMARFYCPLRTNLTCRRKPLSGLSAPTACGKSPHLRPFQNMDWQFFRRDRMFRFAVRCMMLATVPLLCCRAGSAQENAPGCADESCGESACAVAPKLIGDHETLFAESCDLWTQTNSDGRLVRAASGNAEIRGDVHRAIHAFLLRG